MQMNAVRTLTVRGQSQGLDRVEADLNKVSAAQDKVSQTSEGMARTTETSSRRQLSAGRDFQRLMERNDRMVYLQTQLARETATVNRAFEQGAVTAQQHARAIQLVETKYHGLVAAEQQARAASVAASAANDNQASSLHRLAAANDNARFASGNMAAQFQDIAVTAQMGMSPMMIALQQGTQLSAVLNTMQNPVKGLGMAFLSVINPVSLLTIGFVGLTAAAIQFFTASNDNAAKSSDALEAHSEWLRTILRGYEGAQKAANNYMEEAQRLPEATVASDLKRNRQDAVEQYESDIQRISALRIQYQQELEHLQATEDVSFVPNPANDKLIADLRSLLAVVSDAGISADFTAAQFDKLDTALNDVANSRGDERLSAIAAEMLRVLREANAARQDVDKLGVSLDALPSTIVTTIAIRMEQFGTAQSNLADLMPDFRDRYTRMRDEAKAAFEDMRSSATDAILRQQAESDLARVLGGIDRLQAEDAARSASRGGKSDLEKMAGNYVDLTQKASEFIAQQGLVASSLGMTEEAAARLRYEQEMLNQAANDNIALSDAQREEIGALATQMAEAEERTRSLSESFNFGRDVFKGFFSDLRQGLKEGDSLWEAFFNAASNAIDKLLDKAMSAALDQVWMGLWNSILGGLGGGFGTIGVGGVGMPSGGFTPGLTGPWLNAKGNVYDSPGLSAYSNQIHDTPKFFQFAKGAGVFAEAGPEAIMPLGRDGSGRLGVRVAGGGGGAGSEKINVKVINTGQPADVEATSSRNAQGEIDIEVVLRPMVKGMVKQGLADGSYGPELGAFYGVNRRPQS